MNMVSLVIGQLSWYFDGRVDDSNASRIFL